MNTNEVFYRLADALTAAFASVIASDDPKLREILREVIAEKLQHEDLKRALVAVLGDDARMKQVVTLALKDYDARQMIMDLVNHRFADYDHNAAVRQSVLALVNQRLEEYDENIKKRTEEELFFLRRSYGDAFHLSHQWLLFFANLEDTAGNCVPLFPIRLYVGGHAGDRSRAFAAHCENMFNAVVRILPGTNLIVDEGAKWGSYVRRAWAQIKMIFTSEEARQLFDSAKRGMEAQYVDNPRAVADKIVAETEHEKALAKKASTADTFQSQASGESALMQGQASLVTAISDLNNSSRDLEYVNIQLGPILYVKRGSSVVVRTLSRELVNQIENTPALISSISEIEALVRTDKETDA